MEQRIKQSILATLAYFDIFDYPLTQLELGRFLYAEDGGKWKDTEVAEQLRHLENIHQLRHKEGYYFLFGREEIVDRRQRNIWFIERKMKKAIRGVKKLAHIPFVRAVFVCNTVSGVGIDEKSDIDVFIITKKGRIFLARAIATLYLSLFNLRRTKRKVKDKICLSFYVADDNLNLQGISLPDLSGVASAKIDLSGVALAKPDIYLMYWLAQLIPVYDPDNLLSSLQKANTWVKKYLPNAFSGYDLLSRWQVENNKFWQSLKFFFEKTWQNSYGDLLEKQAKEMQLNKMKMNYTSVQNEPDTRVIVNDKMLKFHEKDKRAEYRERWVQKFNGLDLG